ncbi:MAG TPA: HisA/HisF-related TIM barrel protein, partial [Acidimicrobiales bacterium]|nr:HisA/HisF-related TIM barrel protein [Acidimicrobiales bacterium]
MELWPAIDITQGRCVRLRQGDFARQTEYGDPLEVATRYLEAGAKRLHVVDLDAARSGEAANRETIVRIARRTGRSGSRGRSRPGRASARASPRGGSPPTGRRSRGRPGRRRPRAGPLPLRASAPL